MRRLCMTAIGLVLAICFAIGSHNVNAQSTSNSLSAELPSNRLLSRYGLERGWWAQATLNPSRDKVRFIVIDEENVYVQATNGTVTAFDADGGKRLWMTQLGYRDEPIFPGVTNDKHLFVVQGRTMYCLERFSGDVVWELNLPAMPSVAPAVDDDHIYIGTLDGSVYSFEMKKINQLYQKKLLPRWSNNSLRWRYNTGKEITTPPFSTGRLVNFASRDGSLYAVSTTERKLTWQFETKKPISAPFAALENSLIVASEDFYVYCLNRENGLVRWQFASGLPIRKAPRVVGQDVFVMPDRGGLFSLYLGSGYEKWWRPGLSDFLAATKTRLFTSDRTGNVVIVQRKDGLPLGSLPLRAFNVRLENERTDRLFMATSTGLVVCIREQGSAFATYHRHPDREPLIPEVEPDEPPAEGAAAEAAPNDANAAAPANQ